MARTEAAQCIDFLLQRESTVENEAAATDKPEHLVRLLFIYPQLKFVRLHASSSHNIFAYLSPARLDLAQHSPEFELKHDLKKPSGKIPLIALLSIPGIIAGAFGTLSISWAEFVRQSEYKASPYGKTVLCIGQFEWSSKLCACGRINRDQEPSDCELTCYGSGATHEGDVLAANDIKQMALSQIRRDTPESTPQERKR